MMNDNTLKIMYRSENTQIKWTDFYRPSADGLLYVLQFQISGVFFFNYQILTWAKLHAIQNLCEYDKNIRKLNNQARNMFETYNTPDMNNTRNKHVSLKHVYSNHVSVPVWTQHKSVK